MRSISIPITNDGTGCVSKYSVEYKTQTDPSYTRIDDQLSSPIVINNLSDNTEYSIRITRYCCDGGYGNPAVFTFTTSGTLIPPENFTATPFVGPEIQLEWDNDPMADNYIIERALDSGFTMSVVEVYNGPYTASVLNTSGLIGATTYYFRIRSQKTGSPDSGYSYANATTP